LSSKLQQSTSTTFTWGETLLTSKELNIAKKEAFKELRSIQRYVKNGVAMHSKASANEKTADEELVRTALESIENMDLTQSNVAMLIAALHRLGVEAKLDAIFDIEGISPL
tara:strand:- start:416 stop:748 length:333 start_codon:yes stop_codon:yes gene_type:complete